VNRSAGRNSFSVVIPLFNKEKAIAATLASVLRQTRLPDEIIVIDDGSTDDSVRIAREALSAGPKVPFTVLSQENAGVSAARNAGARAARSAYIAFLDADDEWLPGFLAEIERLACSFPQAAVLTTRNSIRAEDGSIAPARSALPDRFFGMVERPLHKLRKSPGLIHSSSVAIRRDAWERAGGFPVGASQGEDLFLWLKLGLTEAMAHSSAPLSIFNAQHSESDARRDVVGHHFAFFLGTSEGRAHLSDPDLRRYLSSHLFRRIVFRRLAGHSNVEAEHRRLASFLPAGPRLACLSALIAPLWLLRGALDLQRLQQRR
jgi:glycosyltransferase involved in cell wall biosynthesis